MDITELRDGSMVGVVPNGYGGRRYYFYDNKPACGTTMQDDEKWVFVWDTSEIPEKVLDLVIFLEKDRPSTSHYNPSYELKPKI